MVDEHLGQYFDMVGWRALALSTMVERALYLVEQVSSKDEGLHNDLCSLRS